MKLLVNLLKYKKMKNNISLSLKKTLRIALPCLALSLFATSCSNDDSAVLPESSTKGKTISFTAVASELTENYATRVGLDKDRIPSSNLSPEPIIWLDGDKFAFNFVKYGEATGQVIEFTATAIRNGGLACTMTADINLENGLYQVYVLTPNTSGAFHGNAVAGTVIDLRGQSQPDGTTDYSNLSDYYYQSAYTIFEIKDNEVVAGSTDLTFTGLTSMLRYQITSNLDSEVTIKKIKISHDGDSPHQFYTRGYFDPSTGSSVVPAGSAIPTLSMLTNELLEPASTFNAYMTLLPTEGLSSGDFNMFSVTAYFYQGQGTNLYQKTWSWAASDISNYGIFPVASRFMFNLTLRPGEATIANPNELNDFEEEELTDEDIPASTPGSIQHDGYLYTFNQVSNDTPIFFSTSHAVYVQGVYYKTACPAGYHMLTIGLISVLSGADRTSLFNALLPYASGYVDAGTYYNNNQIYVTGDLVHFQYWWGGYQFDWSVWPQEWGYVPICRRAIN